MTNGTKWNMLGRGLQSPQSACFVRAGPRFVILFIYTIKMRVQMMMTIGINKLDKTNIINIIGLSNII